MGASAPDETTIVGRYAIFGEIAAGGMATVHYGRLLGPIGFSRTVAVKRLHDRDKSAWWLAIFYGVPILFDSAAYAVGANLALFFVAPAALINLWALIEFGFLRGSLGPNRFGDDPTGFELPPPLPAG